jgi:hypothetical protein
MATSSNPNMFKVSESGHKTIHFGFRHTQKREAKRGGKLQEQKKNPILRVRVRLSLDVFSSFP